MKNMTPFVSLLLAVSACTGIPENKKNALPQDVELLSGEVRNRFIPDKRVILGMWITMYPERRLP